VNLGVAAAEVFVRGRAAAAAEEDGGVETAVTEEEEIGLCAKFSLMLS
jgi:hypothetical protein